MVLVIFQTTPGLSNMVERHTKKRIQDPQQQADPLPKFSCDPGSACLDFPQES